jgi:F-type H+-transporting ATPase subunit a
MSGFASGGGEGKFEPGPFITDHIGDAYEWHIATVGETHVSLPLPVILYSEKSGFHIFMSSKFHHGTEKYKDFIIAPDGDNKGKIVETNSCGCKQIRPWDFSITKNVLALFISVVIILWLFFSVAKSYKQRDGKPPKGLQSLIEPIIIFIRDDIALASIGKKKHEKYLPFLLTVFFFIFLNNLMGLVPIFPGGANLTGNIAVTMVLAIFTFIITTISGNKGYWQHIINAPGVPWWLKFPIPLMPVVEIIGVFTKPFVLMVRLFANITAGHIIALGFFSLIFIFGEMAAGAGYGFSVISIAFTVFMTVLELLVAFIQAYVFTLLSALYFGMATEEHH